MLCEHVYTPCKTICTVLFWIIKHRNKSLMEPWHPKYQRRAYISPQCFKIHHHSDYTHTHIQNGYSYGWGRSMVGSSCTHMGSLGWPQDLKRLYIMDAALMITLWCDGNCDFFIPCQRVWKTDPPPLPPILFEGGLVIHSFLWWVDHCSSFCLGGRGLCGE